MKKILYIVYYILLIFFSIGIYTVALSNNTACYSFKTCNLLGERGNSKAQFNLGIIYHEGKLIEKNERKAFQWFKKSALQGNSDAQYALAYMLYHGIGTNKNTTEAINWLTKAADNNNSQAADNLHWMYSYGYDVPKNKGKALHYYKISLLNENKFFCLDDMLIFNAAISKSAFVNDMCKTDFDFYKTAAKQGIADAQETLAIMYEMQRFVKDFCIKPSKEKASYWRNEAAEGGDIDARLKIVNQDLDEHKYQEAFYWAMRIINENKEDDLMIPFTDMTIVSAMQDLIGDMYYDGQSIPQDYFKAFKYFKMASENGNSISQMNLATMYLIGKGIKKNYILAYVWLNVFLAQQNKEIDNLTKLRGKIFNQLTEQQKEEAEYLSNAYWKKYVIGTNVNNRFKTENPRVGSSILPLATSMVKGLLKMRVVANFCVSYNC